MDAIKRGILACFFWGFVTVASAEEGATFLSDPQEDEIIDLVYSQLRASIEELEKNIEKCEILERNNVLDPTLLQRLPLTDQEKRTSLGYFLYIAQNECYGAELFAKIHLEFAQLKYMEKYYKGKNIKNIEKTEQYLDSICCMVSRRHFESKWKYLKIAPEIRKELERMPELQKPFDVIKSVRGMGLL
ncbi:MAG TPA: hypothetical protein ENI94_03645 [Gammaproteobacteria bacterium]|nr:hypothetical protein [Gammaproteobacteria bacterium]